MNHYRRPVLRIVEEVHGIGAAAPMHNVLAVQRVLRRLLAHRAGGAVIEHTVLLGTQAIRIVLRVNSRTIL